MSEFVERTYASHAADAAPAGHGDRALARKLTLAPLAGKRQSRVGVSSRRAPCKVIGITGPGGAGKTTLIDELILRFLNRRPRGRLAILSHDPSLSGEGALLGDRATMVYAQDDRVFMRSLGTRGHPGGLAASTRACLELLRVADFEAVLVETTGIGQEDEPFKSGLADRQILVMSPDYGSRLQLQKIGMLERADLVVVNKSDLPASATAVSEIEQRLASNRKRQPVIATVAKRHRDGGVDRLFAALEL